MTGELGEEMLQSDDVVSSKTLQSGSQNAVGEGGNKKSVGMLNSKSKYGQQGKCCYHSLIIIVVTFVATLATQQTGQLIL
jgi:hypothetical protein